MRGYRVLKQSGQLDRVATVKQALTEHQLGLTKEHFSPVVMGCGIASGEIIVRQYLLIRLGGIDLNRALLIALGTKGGQVVFPLPKEWRKILTQHGFKVANFWSALLWQFYVCALLLYGVAIIGKIAFTEIASAKKGDFCKKSYAYFVGLAAGNLPKRIDGRQSYDIISWYMQKYAKKLQVEVIKHSVNNSSPIVIDNVSVLPESSPLPELRGWGAIFKYVFWGLRAFVVALLDYSRGRWWHALLLNQAALSGQARLLPVDYLAKEYWFHNSGWIYRPLWTYDVEQAGSEIIFYFYSTNCEGFKTSPAEVPIPYGWKAANWSRYLVWDQWQADFIRKSVGPQAPVEVVGPIWFSSSMQDFDDIPENIVSVFDVQPMRNSFYCSLGLDIEYYIPSVANRFLEDIYMLLSNSHLKMALKRKRDVGRFSHPHYRNTIKNLETLSNFVMVNPDMAAWELIKKSKAVISMPYTSTALIGRELGKPSVYYDPTGMLRKDDSAAHGILILNGQEELKAWVRKALNVQH